MPSVTNARVIFNDIPTGYPEPGKTTVYDESTTIDLDAVPLNGGVLVKTLFLSVDPFLRGMMRDPGIDSYSPAFKIGEPIYGYGVARVLRSEIAGVEAGSYVEGIISFQQYNILPNLAPDAFHIIDKKHKVPLSYYLGALGMPGKTAFMGWRKFSQAKEGETAFVTTGAGPVGSFVIQLAKLAGLKVIASAGSEDKVAFMRSVGADVAFNYKTTNTLEILRKEGPIDVYWDHVGGETLDAALETARVGGRFIECGMITQYNNPGPETFKNIVNIMTKSLSVHGFIVLRELDDKLREEFYNVVPELVSSGNIQYREEIHDGLESAGNVFLAVQKGLNKAKAVIRVAEDV
ncbi:alcohol dehydrogenase [Coprinopsis marcescibilis]|uniref:Alcohol dehydrogenase n=1 Tax=Coprinopsis marcescibilis TaxID=230819 RepID=A0A5C3L3E3_COPMA|nr:alcohol dehydrogenase [Coprinopsis marcescibilis]